MEMRAAKERGEVLQVKKGEIVGGQGGRERKEGGSLTGHLLLMRILHQSDPVSPQTSRERTPDGEMDGRIDGFGGRSLGNHSI